MQTQKITSAVTIPGDYATVEPVNLTRRIGSTNYKVKVHFSRTSTETIDDKILRLIKNDAALGKAAGE